MVPQAYELTALQRERFCGVSETEGGPDYSRRDGRHQSGLDAAESLRRRAPAFNGGQDDDARFPTPLLYNRSLRLRKTVNEPDVVQILANVVHGGA